MLQDLATSLSTTLATASMLFFVAVYVVVAVRLVRARPEDLDAQARLALDDDLQAPAARLDPAAHE